MMSIREQKYLDNPKYWGLSDADYERVLKVRIARLEAALVEERAYWLHYLRVDDAHKAKHAWRAMSESERAVWHGMARADLLDEGLLP